MVLVGKEGRALHEENRERHHSDICDRIDRIDPTALGAEAFAALPQFVDQALEMLRANFEPETAAFANPLSRGSGAIGFRLWRIRLSDHPLPPASRDSSALRTLTFLT